MKANTINIISYIPDDRQDRVEYLNRTLKSLAGCGMHINVLAMWGDTIYSKVQYPTNLSVKLIKAPGMKQAGARNILLSMFYQTDEDYAVFMDDDMLFKTKTGYDIKQYLDFMIANIKFDILGGVFHYSMPDKEFDVYLTRHLSGGCFFIKNFKKYYNEEKYFDTEYTVLEDAEFGTRLLSEGYAVYRCTDFNQMSGITNNSTIYKNDADRSELNKQWHDKIVDKYTEITGYNMKTAKSFINKLMREKGYERYTFSYEAVLQSIEGENK